MVKRVIFLMAIFIVILCPSFLLANIDNLTNMSAEWIRTSNRNAATDATDIVNYNPGGVTRLSDGLHLNISNQTMTRKPTHSFNFGSGEQEYEQDTVDWILPNFYAAYNWDRWSVFGGIYIPGGGAVVDYPNGSFTTQSIGEIFQRDVSNDFLEASSLYLTTLIGVGYEVNSTISFAVAIRRIDVENAIKAGLTLSNSGVTAQRLDADIEETANGCGFTFGVNIVPRERWNIGIHFESAVTLDLETKVKTDDLGIFVDGEKNRRDFPGMAGIGVSYNFTKKLTGEVDYNYWFQTQANWGITDDGRNNSDLAGDAWSFGGTLAYEINPKFLVSMGSLYTKFMWDDIHGYYNMNNNMGAIEVLYSDNWNIALGFAYEFIKDTKLNFALNRTFWDDETIQTDNGPVETENSTIVIAFGVDVSF